MATDIGVRATGDREVIERIAAKRHTTAEAVVKKERARMRRLFGRGALYRADILGTDAVPFFGAARYNAQKRRTA